MTSVSRWRLRASERLAVALEQHQQRAERQQQDELLGLGADAVGHEQPDRGDAGVHRPHGQDHLQRTARGPGPRQPAAEDRARQIDRAAGEEGAAVDHCAGSDPVRPSGEGQHRRRADHGPAVGHGEQDLLAAAPARPGGAPRCRARAR